MFTLNIKEQFNSQLIKLRSSSLGITNSGQSFLGHPVDRYMTVDRYIYEGVVAQWCNPLNLKPEQLGEAGSITGRTPPFERHDKGSRTRLGLFYFCDPSAWR